MSQNPQALQLPFLVRDMLRFEGAVAFGLKLEVQSLIAGTLTIRGLTREGMFTYKQALLGNSLRETYNFRLPDVPTEISVLDESNNQIQGTCYARISLTANGETVYNLCTGYVYAHKGISFPQTTNEATSSYIGQVTGVITANPAAGANWSAVVPNGQMWRIIAITFSLTTAAAAANRRVHLHFTTTDGPEIETYPSVDQVISTTITYNCAHYGYTPDETNDDRVLINIPPNILMRAGDEISSHVTNMNVGDNLTSASILVEKFLVPPVL